MSLARPWFLLLLLLPLAWWWWRRRQRPPATEYSDMRLINLVKEADWLARVPAACRFLAFTTWVLAAAGPRLGGSQVEMKKEGIAIVIAVDISSSMLAEDFSPSNRMEVAKQQAAAFIKGRSADRIGVVAFAGEALTQVPITVDYPVLEQAVASLRIGMLEDGTAIGTGLATAVNRLREAPGKSKVILLLTDGENNRARSIPGPRPRRHPRWGFGCTPSVGTEGKRRFHWLVSRVSATMLPVDRRAAPPRHRRHHRRTLLPRQGQRGPRPHLPADRRAGEDTDPGHAIREVRRDREAAGTGGPAPAGTRIVARGHAGGENAVTFDSPILLALAPVLGAAVGAVALLARRRRIGRAAAWSVELERRARATGRWAPVLIALAGVAAGVGLAGPRGGGRR
jgi:hypothetical protein